MLRIKGKGQGLVEFALILPVLLLLLLGIIESARVIWGYMSVQTAVREAARYAISGKPYVTSNNSPFCFDPQGDPNASSPWVCDPYSRTVAIEAVAMNRITTTLPYSTLCNSDTYNLCQSVPNAFGVRVVGQYTDPLTPSVVITGVRHSGTQGLNVKITAFYNVQMIDPVFDAIMGGNFIPVRGEISMQNEGIDKVLGGVPPPAIGNTTSISGTTGNGNGPNGEEIKAGNYRIPQLGNLPVSLISHFNLAGPYDIYLSGGTPELTFKVCSGVNTNPVTNNGDFDCFISGTIPPGFYTLYSTLFGDENPLATDLSQQVEIYTSNIAQIQVDNGAGGNIAAVNSDVTITLISHQVPDQNFNLYLVYGANPPQLIIPNVTVASSPLTWHVPLTLTNPTNPCPVGGGTPCLIQSRRVVSPTQVYASGEFYLNQPEIVIQGGLRTFAQNETMHITLRGHSPGLAYDLKISDGGANMVWQGRTLVADAVGEVKTPINWTVPPTWPNGNYTISSHPATGTPPPETRLP